MKVTNNEELTATVMAIGAIKIIKPFVVAISNGAVGDSIEKIISELQTEGDFYMSELKNGKNYNAMKAVKEYQTNE